MAHRTSFDRRIPIGVAVAGTLGVAVYLGYKKYRSVAASRDSPEHKDESIKERGPSETQTPNASPIEAAAASTKPIEAPTTEQPKDIKADFPKPPMKPQVPKQEPEPPKPAAQQPKLAAQGPKSVTQVTQPEAHESEPDALKPISTTQDSKSETFVPAGEKSIPSPIATVDPALKMEPLSPKQKAEMASIAEIQLEQPQDQKDPSVKSHGQIDLTPATAASQAENDPLVSLHSWGDLEQQFASVNRRHSPSEHDIPPSAISQAKSDSSFNIVGDQRTKKASFPESDNPENQDSQDLPSPFSLKSWEDLLSSGPQKILSPIRSLESSTYSFDSSHELDNHDTHDLKDIPPTTSDDSHSSGYRHESNSNGIAKESKVLPPPPSPLETGRPSAILKKLPTDFEKEFSIDISQMEDFLDKTDAEIPSAQLDSTAMIKLSPDKRTKSDSHDVVVDHSLKSEFLDPLEINHEELKFQVGTDRVTLSKDNLVQKNGSVMQNDPTLKGLTFGGEAVVEDNFSTEVGSCIRFQHENPEVGRNNSKIKDCTVNLDDIDTLREDQSHLISKKNLNSSDKSYGVINSKLTESQKQNGDQLFSAEGRPAFMVESRSSESVASVDSLEENTCFDREFNKLYGSIRVNREPQKSSDESKHSAPIPEKSKVSVNTNSPDSLDDPSENNSRSYADALKTEIKPGLVPSSGSSNRQGDQFVGLILSDSKDTLESPLLSDLNLSTSSILSSPETTHYWSADKGTGEPHWSIRSLSRNSESCSSIDSLELRQRRESESSNENYPYTSPLIGGDGKSTSRDEEPKPVVISLRWKKRLDDSENEVTVHKEVVDLGMQVVTTIDEEGKFIHQVFNVLRTGPAHRMGLRNNDFFVRLNGMPVTRWSHDVLLEQLRLLSESEFIMTVQRKVNNEIFMKNLQTRVRKTKRGIAVAGEIFDVAESQLPRVRDMQVSSSAGIDNPCQCMISSEDGSKFLSIQGHRLKLLPKQENNKFLFSRHLFNCTSQSPPSPSSNTTTRLFVVVISGWIDDVTKAAYITVVGRNHISVMKHHRVSGGMNELTYPDARFFYHHQTSGYDCFESTQLSNHFIAWDGEKVFLKMVVSTEEIETDTELRFKIKYLG